MYASAPPLRLYLRKGILNASPQVPYPGQKHEDSEPAAKG